MWLISLEREVDMEKIMAIIGSPRKGGNTEVLTDKMVEGCKSRGEVEVEKFFIIDKDIKYCNGCLTCVNPGEKKCVIKDDMEGILERMEECDGFIFATPNHVRSVTAPMLNFLTRMLPLLEVKVERDSEGNIVGGGFNSRLEGKKAAMVISQGDPIISSFLVFELLERNFIDYNLLRIGEVISIGNTGKGDVKEKKNDLEAAFTIGKILAS
jgi:multimeric flavodoxin WrbA